ncbi:hypothetical protein [Nocardia sp. NPDC049526]|uniref:hypothetical protein n=1 Tax=Nocardia sp. NPDC049526 TaxID=3364316 RepID=UPI0037B5D588
MDHILDADICTDAATLLCPGTGIANAALREPMTTAERALGEAFPGRNLLGLGGQRVGGRSVEA